MSSSNGEYKKNKGTILKFSVDYICGLRQEIQQLEELAKEAKLATSVIHSLVTHIQVRSLLLARLFSSDSSVLEYTIN
ncbi:hypothetical protein Ciccas_004382 [Cichlidogyrus casuarinus]|uniref:BHLH domain-containing protein n=1 Tax=Cichlidogyrus casuarinus TaxID=1844966 RepID=A0ABD2QBQ6_9PLAT